MTAPRLSVALPVRNGQNFLAEALDSILAQRFGDFELVVSDNASTDGTPDILADYARRDGRVKPSRSEAFLPLGENMNRAVGLSRSPWVKLLCHDDLMREDCLAQIDALLDAVASTNVALIGNGERHLFANGYLSDAAPDAPPVRLAGAAAVREALGGGVRTFVMPAVTTATVNKAAFDRIGRFDARFEHFDIFCWLRLLVEYDFAYLPSSLTTNRIHGGQVTGQSRKTMGWVRDYRTFIPEYIAEHGETLGLSPRVRMRARALPLNIAAKALATELAAGRWSTAASMARQLPAHWLPLVAPLSARAWHIQRKHLTMLREKVPSALVSP